MFKIFAILKKDFLIEASYKLALFANIFSVFTTLLIYFFIDKLFGQKMTPHLAEFGTNYFSYVLLSLALFSYIGVGIGSFSSRIRYEQMQGTLESLLLSPTKAATILLGMGLWNLIIATIDILIYILLGMFMFNIDFSALNPLSAIVILLLAIISFNSLGILSASFILVFKRGNPVSWIINTIEGLIGGVYFPITVLPDFLQQAAKFFPMTYAIRGMELAVYKGYSVAQLKTECGVLFIFAVILPVISLASFRYALKKARQQGSLVQF